VSVLGGSRLACGGHAGRAADWGRVGVTSDAVTIGVDKAAGNGVVKVHLLETLLERLTFICLCICCQILLLPKNGNEARAYSCCSRRRGRSRRTSTDSDTLEVASP